MVYVIGFINSRLLGFCYCCFVVLFLFVVRFFDFVIVVMIYGINYFIIYCIAYVVFSFCCLLFWFILLFSIRCCSPVISIYPIEFVVS